jgi:hypothetical protein
MGVCFRGGTGGRASDRGVPESAASVSSAGSSNAKGASSSSAAGDGSPSAVPGPLERSESGGPLGLSNIAQSLQPEQM